MKNSIIITVTLTLALAATANAEQKEVKGYWISANESIPVFRCTTDLDCERKNPHIREDIRNTHVFVPVKGGKK